MSPFWNVTFDMSHFLVEGSKNFQFHRQIRVSFCFNSSEFVPTIQPTQTCEAALLQLCM